MSKERFLNLAIVWRRYGSGELVLSAGGVWDQGEMDWQRAERGERTAATERVLFEVTPAQERAAATFVAWLRGSKSQWETGPPFYSVVLPAGRRIGKTTLLGALAATFAIFRPGAVIWFVAPSNTGWDEIRMQVERYLPVGSWAYLSDANTYMLVNGARIMLKTPAGRQAGKEGAADLVLINEAQKIPGASSNGGKSKGARYYEAARASTIDRGGLVAVACNPPDTADGLWLDELAERVSKGELQDTRVVNMPQGKNPFADPVALQAWAQSLDARAYAREYEGKLGLPTEDTVLYNWDPDHNVSAWRPGWKDVTAQFMRDRFQFRQDICLIGGHDFNKRPHMAAALGKLVIPPGGNPMRPILWYCAEVIHTGVESEVAELLAGICRDQSVEPSSCLIVADASGEWQNSQRKQQSPPSWKDLQAAGFIVRSPIEAKAEDTHGSNGSVYERMALARRLIRNVAGESRLIISPECEHLVGACRKFELKNGNPSKTSRWGHAVDAVTYPLVRLFRKERQEPPK